LRITDPSGGCRPTAVQELLLKASLLEGEAALEAWRQWHAQVGLERLDHGSFRLLPLLYWNLRRQGCDHPLMGILQGIHRWAWVENRLLFQRLAPALETVHRAGIPTLLLKGAPLAQLHYADVGLRPMNDLDILVPEERALEAIRMLEGKGWRHRTRWKFRQDSDLCFRHSLGFINDEGLELDLHWHALFLACFQGADEALWKESVPMEFEGIPTRTLCPTDQLVHACVHGPMWSEITPMRWVADAFVVMCSSTIDWRRISALADCMRIVLPVREGLQYLVELLAAPVPTALLEEFAQGKKVSRSEILYYQSLQDPTGWKSPLDAVRAVYGRYAHNTSTETPFARLIEFLRFLQFYWNLDRSWKIWPTAVRWALIRLRQAWP
jgi:hypothetical protein